MGAFLSIEDDISEESLKDESLKDESLKDESLKDESLKDESNKKEKYELYEEPIVKSGGKSVSNKKKNAKQKKIK